MATYIDNDTNRGNGRTFVVQADRIVLENPGTATRGTREVLGTGAVANIEAVAEPFASLTAAAEAFNALLEALKDAGVMEADSE
jgi:flagellar basal body P-ring protein FlgI